MARKIIVYDHDKQDKYFYSIMGKYFANREYAKEMGGWQFYTDNTCTYILMQDNDIVIGFCSLFERNTHIFFDNFYIIKEYRNKGYSKKLIDYRHEYALKFNKELRMITDNEYQMKNYDRLGYEKYGMRGRYGKYRYKNARIS